MPRSKWTYLIVLMVFGAMLAAVSAQSDEGITHDQENENQDNEEAKNAFVWKDDPVRKGENTTNENEKLWNGRDEEQNRNYNEAQDTLDGQRNGNLTLHKQQDGGDYADWDELENTPSRVFHSEDGDLAGVDGDEELGNWLQDEIVEQHVLGDGEEEEKKGEEGKPEDVIELKEYNDDDDIFGDFDGESIHPNSFGPDGENLYGEDDNYYGDFDDDLMIPSPDGWGGDGDEAEAEDDDANPNGDEDGNVSHAPRATQTRNEVDKQYEGKNKLQDILNFYRFRKFEPKVSPKDGEAPTSDEDHKQKLDEIRAALRARIFGRGKGDMNDVLQSNINSLNRDGIDNDTLKMHYIAKRTIIHEYATSNLGIALLVGTAFVMVGSVMYALNRQRGPILPLHV